MRFADFTADSLMMPGGKLRSLISKHSKLELHPRLLFLLSVLKFTYLHSTLMYRFDQEQSLVYYYRPNPKDAGCSDPVGKPTGYEYDADSIFVTAIVSNSGTVKVQSVEFPLFMAHGTDQML